MKTPMQELIEYIHDYSNETLLTEVIEKELLEKEKQMVISAFDEGYECGNYEISPEYGEQYYNQTFKK